MIVDAACYQLGQRIPGEFDYEEAGRLITEPDTFAWVGLHEPSPEEFEQAVKTFNLHELAVDDALRAHQRPKLETFDETLFVVTKPARYVDPVEIVEFGEILIFVDPNFVVAVRHGEASRLIEARHKLEADPGRLACGSGSVLHAILNQVVRDYAVVLDELGADIRGIEDDVFSSGGDSERIYRLKQEVLSFHEAVEPLEEPLGPAGHRGLQGHRRHLEALLP